MKKVSQQELEKRVHKFNATYKVGEEVEVLKTLDGKETFIDTIKHEATILGGHTAITWLKEKGCYDLTFVRGKECNN